MNYWAQDNLSKRSHKNLICLEENEVQMFYIKFRKPVHFNMTYNFLLQFVVVHNIIAKGKEKYFKILN